jgi:hypothetical protein
VASDIEVALIARSQELAAQPELTRGAQLIPDSTEKLPGGGVAGREAPLSGTALLTRVNQMLERWRSS